MTTKKTLFVVTETDFSYNDEVYSTEGSGGTPLQAFHTQDEAEKFVKKQTIKWLTGIELAGYGYAVGDIFHKAPSCLSQGSQDTFFDGDTWEMDALLSDKTSKADRESIADAMRLKPYAIHKVSVG